MRLTRAEVERLHGKEILVRASAIVAEKHISLSRAVDQALQEHCSEWYAETISLMKVPILSTSEHSDCASD